MILRHPRRRAAHRSILCLALVAALVGLFPANAAAYIDPGSGSVMLQVLVGGLLALGVTIRLYWHRLMGLFRRGGDKPDRLDLDD
jgi:hypothetical protein